MLGQTFRLFIKALIIGILLNMGLQKVAAVPLPTRENIPLHRQLPLSESPTQAEFHFSDPRED